MTKALQKLAAQKGAEISVHPLLGIATLYNGDQVLLGEIRWRVVGRMRGLSRRKAESVVRFILLQLPDAKR